MEAHDGYMRALQTLTVPSAYLNSLQTKMAGWTVIKFKLSHVVNEPENNWWKVETQLNRELWPRRRDNIMSMLVDYSTSDK